MSEMEMLREAYRVNDLIYKENKKWYDNMKKMVRKSKILCIFDRIEKK